MFINSIRPRFNIEFSEQCEFILIIIQKMLNVHNKSYIIVNILNALFISIYKLKF